MKKNFKQMLLTLMGLMFGVFTLKAQTSTNTVKYKITYDATTQLYTAWVIPDYAVPNANNAGTTEKGGTAQFTIVVPKDFVITQITDIKGTWTKTNDSGFTKLGPGVTGQTWTGLDPTLNYYVIGKTPSETDYGTFAVGVPVSLFSFKGNGCFGPVKPLPAGDPFIAAADATYSLNVANSFYSRSGQPAGGNVNPLEQFINITGLSAECATVKPVIYASDDNAVTNKGVAVSGNILINDNLNTGTAPLVVTTTPIALPTNGTVTLNANGAYTYTPTAGFTGADSFKYRVCDSGSPAVCDTATVTVNVTDPAASNHSPIALSDNATTKPNTAVSGNVLLNDTDPDAGQTLTASLVTGPTHGTLTLNPDGTYTYTPAAGFEGNDKFTYKACDNGSPQLCTNAVVDILVSSAANLPPVANADISTRTPTGTATGNLLANDKDPEGTALVINTTPVVQPAHGTVVINPDGTFTYTPAAGYTGPDQFTYEVCDSGSPKMCSQAVVFIIPNSIVGGNADLRITKTLVGNKIVAINDVVTYTVVVKNLGPDAATNVVVKDSVSAGLALLSGQATKGTFSSPLWSIPSIASGDSAVLTVTAKVLTEGLSYNWALIKNSDQTDGNTSNNTTNTCVTVPFSICAGQGIDVSAPAGFTNVVWKDAQGNVVPSSNGNATLTKAGTYTFTATNGTCPTGGCCPVVVVDGNCCPTNICIPFTTVKRKL